MDGYQNLKAAIHNDIFSKDNEFVQVQSTMHFACS